jgi:predicted kinase
MTLIAFSGLPGAGKTTIARAASEALGAVFLRVDRIEQALRDAGHEQVGHAGYAVAYALADENLRRRLTVIADSVNALTVTREAWAAVAQRSGVPIIEVEVICSDLREHQRRVATRTIDVAGLVAPTWPEIQARTYEPWTRVRLVLDTAVLTVDESVARLVAERAERAR